MPIKKGENDGMNEIVVTDGEKVYEQPDENAPVIEVQDSGAALIPEKASPGAPAQAPPISASGALISGLIAGIIVAFPAVLNNFGSVAKVVFGITFVGLTGGMPGMGKKALSILGLMVGSILGGVVIKLTASALGIYL